MRRVMMLVWGSLEISTDRTVRTVVSAWLFTLQKLAKSWGTDEEGRPPPHELHVNVPVIKMRVQPVIRHRMDGV